MDAEPSERLNAIEQAQKPKLEIGAKSIPSEVHPHRNEDAIFQLPEKRAFGVFDGMGGYAGGDKASRLARDRVAQHIKTLPEGLSVQQAKDAIHNALIDANRVVYTQAQAEKSDMGSTAVVAYIWEGQGQQKAIVGSVGDSRAYVYRGGKLEQITLDDNLVKQITNDEQKARMIQTRLNNVIDPNNSSQLPPDERYLYDKRNLITQAIGTKDIAPNIYSIDLQPGDKLLLVSDGISDNLTDREITEIIARSPNRQVAVKELTEASKNRSRDGVHLRHKQDDMSALIAEISSPVYREPEAQALPASQLVKEAERLRKGDVVKVQRSNGTIEEGWEIVGFNPLTGDARVTRKEGTQILQKEISQSQLQSLNPVREETALHNAQDFMQLFKAIDAAGNIQGHSQIYDPTQLKHLINKVRSGKEPIDVITRVEGIRQKVAELMAADKIRRSL